MAKGLEGLVIALVTAPFVSTKEALVSVRAFVDTPFVADWMSVTSAVACLFLGEGVSVSAQPARMTVRKRGRKRSNDFIVVALLGDLPFAPALQCFSAQAWTLIPGHACDESVTSRISVAKAFQHNHRLSRSSMIAIQAMQVPRRSGGLLQTTQVSGWCIPRSSRQRNRNQQKQAV